MKKILFALAMVYLVFCSCTSSSNSNDIVGIWQEYREDGNNYGLSSWKFNSDGSGIFTVQGITSNEQVAFTWEKKSSSIKINMNNGDVSYLSIDNGLLIENSAFGTYVFKKK